MTRGEADTIYQSSSDSRPHVDPRPSKSKKKRVQRGEHSQKTFVYNFFRARKKKSPRGEQRDENPTRTTLRTRVNRDGMNEETFWNEMWKDEGSLCDNLLPFDDGSERKEFLSNHVKPKSEWKLQEDKVKNRANGSYHGVNQKNLNEQAHLNKQERTITNCYKLSKRGFIR
jgi:hypothetical protein